jgi:hypothetical protein
VIFPTYWKCVPGCVCWTLGSCTEEEEAAATMALRLAVHRAGNCIRESYKSLKSVVHSNRISARGIARVLSEMHVGENGLTWSTTLSQAICWRFWVSVSWLLDLGACPNLGETDGPCGTARFYCAMRRRQEVLLQTRTVLQLAGGLDLEYHKGKVWFKRENEELAEWERYHRAERTAWMQAVARCQCIKY